MKLATHLAVGCGSRLIFMAKPVGQRRSAINIGRFVAPTWVSFGFFNTNFLENIGKTISMLQISKTGNQYRQFLDLSMLTCSL
ncbi:hypothetical protein ACC692_19190 [Rhizobium ruizarguesonis]